MLCVTLMRSHSPTPSHYHFLILIWVQLIIPHMHHSQSTVNKKVSIETIDYRLITRLDNLFIFHFYAYISTCAISIIQTTVLAISLVEFPRHAFTIKSSLCRCRPTRQSLHVHIGTHKVVELHDETNYFSFLWKGRSHIHFSYSSFARALTWHCLPQRL